MADAQRTVKLHVATTADEGGLTKATVALQQVEAAAAKVHLNQATLATETDKATRSTSQFGQAALSAAFFVDDMQYGIKGVLNNIPMLAMSLGMGGGVAGVVSILAVGFSVLSDKMGWFAKEAATTTGELQKLVVETRDAAAAATSEAQQTNIAEAALKKHNDTLRDAADGYKELAAGIDAAAKAREVAQRNLLAETDAEAALQLARIEGMRANGAISDQEAEASSLTVKRGAEEKRFASEQLKARKDQMDLEAKAAALSGVSGLSDSRASDLDAASGGLLDAEGRKAAEARMENAGAQLKAAKAKADAEAEMIMVQRETYGPGGTQGQEAVRNPAYDIAQQRLAEAARNRAEAAGVLERDTVARGRTGFGDADALRQEVDKLRREADEARREAGNLRGSAGLVGADRASQAKIFGMDSERALLQSSTRVAGYDARDAAAEAKRRAAEGQDVLTGARGMKDVPEGAMTALAAAIAGADNGLGGSGEKLTLLLKQLTDFLKRTKQQNAGLEKDTAELRSQIAEGRAGR